MLDIGEETGAANLLSGTVTPFLYAHYKLNEGAGDWLYDSSGNDRHFQWNQGAPDYPNPVNATADLAGIWTDEGIAWGALANHDKFISVIEDAFTISDDGVSGIYIAQVTVTGVLTGGSAILSRRRAIAGPADAGFQFQLNLTNPSSQFVIHDGTNTIAGATSPNTWATDEKYTVAFCKDWNNGVAYLLEASDTSIVQYDQDADKTFASPVDMSKATEVACVGARGVGLASEGANNMTVHNIRCYEDANGGALPNNLGDIVRWLHQNPVANIPAEWWS